MSNERLLPPPPPIASYNRSVESCRILAILAASLSLCACKSASPGAPGPVQVHLDARADATLPNVVRDSARPSGATQISVALDHGCARMRDATAWCWGNNDRGQLGNEALSRPLELVSTISSVTDVVEVRNGRSFTCARTTAGEIYCWGVDDAPVYGQGVTAAKVARIGVEVE